MIRSWTSLTPSGTIAPSVLDLLPLARMTADNGELMTLCGYINPYPGRLGVVEMGALADLLLVDGNPLENIDLVADPSRNFKLIMKDGIVYKNELS